MQITMTGSLSNNLIKRDKNNAISNYRESANCNLGLLAPSSLSVKVLSNYKHRTSTPAAREHYKLCVFLLQVTPSTAVDRQIYSVHARDTHENDEADL